MEIKLIEPDANCRNWRIEITDWRKEMGHNLLDAYREMEITLKSLISTPIAKRSGAFVSGITSVDDGFAVVEFTGPENEILIGAQFIAGSFYEQLV